MISTENNEKIINELRSSVVSFRLPRYAEIPSVGLYLEQVIRYVNGYLCVLGDYGLTPSMVSNYVKQKLIPGPVKKSYTAESIAYLIFIAYIKTVVSMDDIGMLVQLHPGGPNFPEAYDYFCGEFESLLRTAYGVECEKAAKTPAQQTVDNQIVNGQIEISDPGMQVLRLALYAVTYKVHLDSSLRIMRRQSGLYTASPDTKAEKAAARAAMKHAAALKKAEAKAEARARAKET